MIFARVYVILCSLEVRAMIESHELKKRELYLNKLIAFQDTEPVKVVTGIRRCGKSSLLKLMILHLKETGVSETRSWRSTLKRSA